MDFLFYTLVAIVIAVLCYSYISVPRNYPNGPRRYPLIGSYMEVLKLKNKLGFLHLVWDHMSKQYGEVFAVKLGLVDAVVVSGYEMVQHVVRNEAFDGRPDGFVFRMKSFYDRLGLVFVDGPMWKEQRQFLVRHFRNMGLGGDKTTAYVNEEINDIVLNIREMSQGGKAIQVCDLFDVAVLNGLWTMIAGHRFELNDPKLKKLMDLTHASFRMLDMAGGLLSQMPFLRYLAPERSGYNQMKHILDSFYAFLKESVDEHRVHDEDDFICSFLNEIDKRKQSAAHSSFREDQLLVSLLDLFLAGTETTSSTLGFTVLELMKHPNVQAKVYAELEAVIGERDVQLTDKKRLPYLDAVLMEVQRLCNVAPLSIAHKTVRDAELKNYIIPKDTLILTSLYSVHMDKNHWGDPEVFRPERFLNNATGELVTDSWFFPFGIGRRRCPGEVLAKCNMFVFIGRIIQKYNIKTPPGVQLPEYPQEGITLSPSPFTAIFEPRLQ